MTLLDDSSAADSIAHELDNKQTDLALQLGELEYFRELDVRFVGVFVAALLLGFQAVQVDTRVEWGQVLLVVRLRVEFEELDVELLDVLEVKFELYLFIDLKVFLVTLIEFQVHDFGDLLEALQADLAVQGLHAVLSLVDADIRLNFLKVAIAEVFGIGGEGPLVLLTEVGQVLLGNLRHANIDCTSDI